MGVVYLAEDTDLNRQVAIKFLLAHLTTDQVLKTRFKREAETAAKLNHPNIVTVHEIGEFNNQSFIVMEYVEGQTLREKAGSVTQDEAIALVTQICEGLNKAHSADIVHRDLKPENIMIDHDNRIRILDFGLAKLKGASKLTRETSTPGTAHYMSPEQVNGNETDHRTDIWAAGVILYELISSRKPFDGEYEASILYAIRNDDPDVITDISPQIEQVLLQALARNPDDRYQAVSEFAGRLQAADAGQSTSENAMSRKPKLSWMVAAGFVLLIIVAYYIFKPASNLGKKKVQTIAVLPFADSSPKKDQEYFSDGLTEELLNVLAKNPQLRVTSRTSAFSYKGTNTDIKTIAANLNVQYILEGSVRKAGKELRITVHLIDVDTDAQLWAETYDATLANIFALQDSISGSVAQALEITLLGNGDKTRQQETTPQAYNAYLLGKHFYSLRGKENWQKAMSHFENTLALDPGYAPAWLGLSRTHNTLADWSYLPFDEGYQKARQEAEKALALDPNLAGAYAQMGWIKQSYDWDWSGADLCYRRGLELEPGNATLINNAASLARTLGRFDEAIHLYRRSIELDPVNIAGYFNLGFFTFYAGLHAESEAAFRKCLELNPQVQSAHMNIGRVYLDKGMPDSALVQVMRETHPVWKMYGLALVHHALGQTDEADNTLTAYITENEDGWAYQIAEIYAYRDEADKSFLWLERAHQQRDPGLTEMKGNPLLRNIRKDRRYAEFLKKMDLPL